jgi:crotonobetainyl-CoA:carnitine CoA-transferase CaiB-like acyl-CoA transferase
MTMPPLQGCRVLDLGIITAGAATSALLADMGAEVIKVESPSYRDPFRQWPVGEAEDKADTMPPFFRSTNRNKAGISLDLKHPQGRAAFLRLVTKSDVVIENFRRGVMARLSLDYAQLKVANGDIVLASISSQGETGPDANHVSYGSTLEAVGGLAWSTGYVDGAPMVSGRDLNYPDQVAAIFSAGMIVTAWRACRGGAGGVHLDISQRELTSFLCGESFIAAGAGIETPRLGNAEPPHRLQDCFRAADGAWVAVTLDEEDVAVLGRLIGDIAAGTEPPGADLRASLSRFVAAREAEACVAELAASGIAAAKVLDGRALLSHRGRLWSAAMAEAGDGEFVKGFPFQLVESPLAIRREAPIVGADTADVLMRIGGYSQADIEALAEAGVIELPQRRA